MESWILSSSSSESEREVERVMESWYGGIQGEREREGEVRE